MAKMTSTATDSDKGATYTFSVVVEPDEDAWFAHCPALKSYAAATWGSTREEALRHIHEVVGMVLAESVEDGGNLPADVTLTLCSASATTPAIAADAVGWSRAS